MAAGSSYPIDILNPEQTKVEMSGVVTFTDASNQPAPAAPPITSGGLPNLGAWVSGTAKVNPVTRSITATVEVVTAGTNTIATCVIALSPDNATYTTLATPGAVAAQNNTGATTQAVQVRIPQGWYIKLTFANCTVAASIYY
jgi:hypothetical protein